MRNEVRAPLHLSPPKLIHMPNPGDDASCEINSDSEDESQVKSSEPEEQKSEQLEEVKIEELDELESDDPVDQNEP